MGKLLNIVHRFAGDTRPIVLMYHRVANLVADPWQLSVTPDHFGSQIEVLKQNRDIVPMYWLAKKLREGRLPKEAAAITFDDGYADFFQNAVPILQQFKCPATIFITSQAIDDSSGFWWDILSRIVLETVRLPRHFTMEIGGERVEWHLLDDSLPISNSNAISRDALHLALHALLKPMDQRGRRLVLDELANWAGTTADFRASDRVLTRDELRQVTAAQEIEIGTHTLTHPSLPLLKPDELHHEVVDGLHECEILSGRTIMGFAYPFGDHDDVCAKAVEAAGLQYALTTMQRELDSQTHPYRIPRVLVADWGEADFMRKVLGNV
jgi:peptidoglycan/xylan/chitin deacetylase (PgdA/CDA1 family)